MPKDKKEQDRIRQANRDNRQRAKGRTQRKYWLTPREHDKVNGFVNRLRDNQNDN